MVTETILLPLECDQCGKSHNRPIKPILPASFSDPKNPLMLLQFWCPDCGAAQAYRIRFMETENSQITAEIAWRIDPSVLYIRKPVSTAITVKPKQKSMRPHNTGE